MCFGNSQQKDYLISAKWYFNSQQRPKYYTPSYKAAKCISYHPFEIGLWRGKTQFSVFGVFSSFEEKCTTTTFFTLYILSLFTGSYKWKNYSTIAIAYLKKGRNWVQVYSQVFILILIKLYSMPNQSSNQKVDLVGSVLD